MPSPEVDAIIAQVQQNVRQVMDQYIGSKMLNEHARIDIARMITQQVESIIPSREGNQFIVEASPDPGDPSLMNVDITFRLPRTSTFAKFSATNCRNVEIDGEVWTKFSIQA